VHVTHEGDHDDRVEEPRIGPRSRGQAPERVRVVDAPFQGLDAALGRARARGEVQRGLLDLGREQVGEAHEARLHQQRVGGRRLAAGPERGRGHAAGHLGRGLEQAAARQARREERESGGAPCTRIRAHARPG
jgi:hypothetical protein